MRIQYELTRSQHTEDTVTLDEEQAAAYRSAEDHKAREKVLAEAAWEHALDQDDWLTDEDSMFVRVIEGGG